eukprot:4355368-Amphidinium_carterae.1
MSRCKKSVLDHCQLDPFDFSLTNFLPPYFVTSATSVEERRLVSRRWLVSRLHLYDVMHPALCSADRELLLGLDWSDSCFSPRSQLMLLSNYVQV